MIDSGHPEAAPLFPTEHGNGSVAGGQPLPEQMPAPSTSGTATFQPGNPAQLYLLIQRVAQQADRLHLGLQQHCAKQQHQISVLTEQRKQLQTARDQMEVMITNVARMFYDFWPSLQPHYPLLPLEIAAASLSEQEIHLRIAVQELYPENHELHAALATRPVQPELAVNYST